MNSGKPLPQDSYSAQRHTSGSHTILYVEDDAEIRTIHGHILEREGYTVRTARDGLEGWDLLCQSQFDLVITDNEMPGIDGLELARRVRAEGLNTTLILSTGSIMSLLESDLSFIRFSAILRKPFPAIDLVDSVRRVLQHRRLHGEHHTTQPLEAPPFPDLMQSPDLDDLSQSRPSPERPERGTDADPDHMPR